jgi:hypothetical protein
MCLLPVHLFQHTSICGSGLQHARGDLHRGLNAVRHRSRLRSLLNKHEEGRFKFLSISANEGYSFWALGGCLICALPLACSPFCMDGTKNVSRRCGQYNQASYSMALEWWYCKVEFIAFERANAAEQTDRWHRIVAWPGRYDYGWCKRMSRSRKLSRNSFPRDLESVGEAFVGLTAQM